METLSLLPELGFTGRSDQFGRIEYELRLGKLKLSVVRSMNKYFREVVIFSGGYVTQHVTGEVCFELPVEVSSLAHLKAFLSYYLKTDVSGPGCVIPKPFWFEEGMSLAHLLPWEVDRARYEVRPRCHIRREWLKLTLKELSSALKEATGHTPVEISFDGEVLRFRIGRKRIVVTGNGNAWDTTFIIPAARISELPKRLGSATPEVSISDGYLVIANNQYRGVIGVSMPLSKSQKAAQPPARQPELIWKEIIELVAMEIEDNVHMMREEMALRGAGDPDELVSKLGRLEPSRVLQRICKNDPGIKLINPHEATPEEKERIVSAVLDLFSAT